MKRKAKLPAEWVLPILTIILVLLAIVLPERISALRDRRLFAAAHVETFDAEQGVASSAMTLEQRLRAVTELSFKESADIYVRYEDAFSDEEFKALDGLFRENIEKLIENGGFPWLQELDVTGLECYGMDRAYIWDSVNLGDASFAQLHYYNDAVGAGVYLAIDEESGLSLSLTAFFPGMETLFVKDDGRMLVELATAFVEPLGFAVVGSRCSAHDAYITLQGEEGNLYFHASQKGEVLNIEPIPAEVMGYDAEANIAVSMSEEVYDAP